MVSFYQNRCLILILPLSVHFFFFYCEKSGFTFLLAHWITDGVAEEGEEGRLEEGVELRYGFPPLHPQSIRRIQNSRNSLLF